MELARQPAGEDAAERAGVLEERRDQYEQTGERDERREPLLDREPGDDVDQAGDEEDGQRLAQDPAEGRVAGPERGDDDQHAQHRRRQRQHRADDVDPDEVGREEERRQRDHVARRGHERRGHVVHVPARPDRTRRDGERQHQDEHRRDGAADDRDHHEVADRDGVGEAEADRDRLGQHGQRQRDRQRERERREDVLAHHRVGPSGQAEGAGVDGRAQPAPERPEDVAPHADGGGHEHQQAGQLLQGVGDGAEGQPGEQVTARRDEQRGEALTDRRRVRADDAADARECPAATRRGHGDSEAPDGPSWASGYRPAVQVTR